MPAIPRNTSSCSRYSYKPLSFSDTGPIVLSQYQIISLVWPTTHIWLTSSCTENVNPLDSPYLPPYGRLGSSAGRNPIHNQTQFSMIIFTTTRKVGFTFEITNSTVFSLPAIDLDESFRLVSCSLYNQGNRSVKRQVPVNAYFTYLRLLIVRGPHARPSLSVCTELTCSGPSCGDAGIGDDEDADIGKTCSSTIPEKLPVSSLVVSHHLQSGLTIYELKMALDFLNKIPNVIAAFWILKR
jgi:hypothetical protein